MSDSEQIKNLKISVSFWSYFFLFLYPVLFLVGSIFMFYAINYSHTIITRIDRHPIGENIFTSVFLLIAILGFIKARNFFNLIVIPSKLPINKKVDVLNKVKEKLNIDKMTEDTFNDFKFIYYGPWYTNFCVDVAIFIDQDGFYINVRDVANFPYFFTFSNRIKRKIINQIEVDSKYY